MQEVKKRQPIYLPGDPVNTVYLLKKGRLKIASADASGKELTLGILDPKETGGLEELPRETFAEPLEDAPICAIRREDFEQYLAHHPALASNSRSSSGFGCEDFKVALKISSSMMCRQGSGTREGRVTICPGGSSGF